MKEADIKLKIIVAEDDEASRQYLSFILKSNSFCGLYFRIKETTHNSRNELINKSPSDFRKLFEP